MKIELTIPSSMDEITLGQYQEFIKSQENNTDELFISQKLVSIFCQIPLSQVLAIPVKEIEYIVEKMGKLFEQKHEFKNTFKLGDKTFGFIPSLEDISLGEFIDIDTNISDLSNFHKAMAVMYRPITKSVSNMYEIENYVTSANYSEVMKLAPVSIALGAQVFFWTLEKESLRALIVYLEEAQKEVTNLAKQDNSVENGVGINTSISSLREMYLDLEMSPEKRYLNV
jgi:hypothetical protein